MFADCVAELPFPERNRLMTFQYPLTDGPRRSSAAASPVNALELIVPGAGLGNGSLALAICVSEGES